MPGAVHPAGHDLSGSALPSRDVLGRDRELVPGGGHTLERRPAVLACVTEVIVGGHVIAVRLGRGCQPGVNGQRSTASFSSLGVRKRYHLGYRVCRRRLGGGDRYGRRGRARGICHRGLRARRRPRLRARHERRRRDDRRCGRRMCVRGACRCGRVNDPHSARPYPRGPRSIEHGLVQGVYAVRYRTGIETDLIWGNRRHPDDRAGPSQNVGHPRLRVGWDSGANLNGPADRAAVDNLPRYRLSRKLNR